MTIAGDRFWDYLKSSLQVSMSDSPVDYYDTYLNEMMSKTKGTVMPPSPGVYSYHLEWKDIGDGIYYRSKVLLADFVPEMVRLLPKEQLLHRSRDVSISSGKYQTVELERRISNYRKAYTTAKEKQLPTRKALELWTSILDIQIEYIRRSTNNLDYFIQHGWKNYVHEHSGSSIGQANSWGNERLTKEQLLEFKDKTISNLEMFRDNPTRWVNIKWNLGIRARANPLLDISTSTTGTIRRSRIISFHPARSTSNALLAHELHGEMLTKMINTTLDIVDPVGDYYTAYAMGGKIFEKFADSLNDAKQGEKYYAFDGAGWDSVVPIVLGPVFNPAMMFAAVPQLPSGSDNTSIWGTVGNIIDTRTVPGKHFVLGDDHGYIGSRPDMLNSPEMTEDVDDSRMLYLLGEIFKYDYYKPRIAGFKITSDRGDLRIGVPIEPDMLSDDFPADRDDTTRAIWLGLYFGEVGDKTLLQAQSKLGPAEHFAPRDLQETLIAEASKEKQFDAREYARNLGLKRVFGHK